MDEVTLTKFEFAYAAQVGLRRQIENLYAGRRDGHGFDPADGWRVHIEGACGECALAKYLDLFWSGSLNDLGATDVGAYQVRTRVTVAGPRTGRTSLILHPDDRDGDVFVLLVGQAPTFRLCGWIYGRDGKQRRYWLDPVGGRPAYFVPADDLHHLDTIPDLRPR